MPVKASLLGPGSLKIGATGTSKEWAAQLTKCLLTPSTDTEDTIPVLSGEELTGDDTETWELSGTILQDYELQSLEDFCFANRGVVLPFEFTPNLEGARSYEGNVKLRALAIGGDVKKRNTTDFTFPATDVAQGVVA